MAETESFENVAANMSLGKWKRDLNPNFSGTVWINRSHLFD